MKNNLSELFTRYEKNPILTADDWPYPVNSVFNAAATQLPSGEVLLLVRVEDRRGISHLTAARSPDGIHDWQIDPHPTFMPDPEHHPEELWGIEDPRITWLPELKKWAIVYSASSRGGPLVALALTEDFQDYERLGAVLPPENRDAAIFPRQFQGRWAMIHRPVNAQELGSHMWLAFSPDLKHWGDHHLLIEARHGAWWDANKIGLSPPPLETPAGWLILYHGARLAASGYIYRLGLALLDLDNPCRVLRRSDEWVFGPEKAYERTGDVDNVVFPCGWIIDPQDPETVLLYYGAADSTIALATARLDELLDFIEACPEPKKYSIV